SPCLIGETEMRCDRREPATGRPAHRRRVGVDMRPAAIFPDARVGGEGKLRRLLAEMLQEMEQRLVSRPRQAAVEEHGHGRENDAAIGVMLALVGRGIDDTEWSLAR